MKRNYIALMSALVLIAPLGSGVPPMARAAHTAPPSLRAQVVATSSVDLGKITDGPDGNLWFTLTTTSGDNIGRITPGGTVTRFALPTRHSAPTDIVSGPDGNLWFTERTGDNIGRITPQGVVTEFHLRGGSAPVGIILGPDGNLWFTEDHGNRLGRITPHGAISEVALPVPSSRPASIATGGDGALWFTEPFRNKIVRFTSTTSGSITSGSYSEFAAGTNPFDIVRGPDGALWFTETVVGTERVGRITGSGLVEFHATGPFDIARGPDHALWFTELRPGKIGRITLQGQIREFAVPHGHHPNDITAGPDGNLWFTEAGINRIGRLAPRTGRIREFTV